MDKIILKFTILLLFIGINWVGLSAVGETFVYFNDIESSSENTFSVGTLDFSLNSENDFLPEVTPTATSSRDILVVNNGSLDFQYTATSTNIVGGLCDYLTLAANLDGNSVYVGPIAGFNYNVSEFSTTTDDWQFTATLTSSDPSLENQTCDFDFVFDGVQIGDADFSDQEIIPNTVSSGSWTEPVPPTTSEYSPIADSYIDQNNSNSNYGGGSELKIKSENPDNKRTFIRFDFNFPNGTNIVSSALKLYLKNAPSASRVYEARRIENDSPRTPWTESGIKWSNQPTITSFTASTTSGIINNVWLSWDVTPDVQSFVSGISNYGWQLKDNTEDSSTAYEAKFHSRNSGSDDLRPILEVVFSAPSATTTHLVINEVYYDVKSLDQGNNPKNEWVEIYNPTDLAIDISGWKICDNQSCEIIPSTLVPAKSFAVVTADASTWTKWAIPPEAVKIVLGVNQIGNGLANGGDRVILKDASDTVIDAMNYGFDTSQFTLPLSGEGKSLARIVKGYDTDSATDWIINATPNPGTNPSGDGIELMRFTSEGVEIVTLSEEEIPVIEKQPGEQFCDSACYLDEGPAIEDPVEENIGENAIQGEEPAITSPENSDLSSSENTEQTEDLAATPPAGNPGENTETGEEPAVAPPADNPDDNFDEQLNNNELVIESEPAVLPNETIIPAPEPEPAPIAEPSPEPTPAPEPVPEPASASPPAE